MTLDSGTVARAYLEACRTELASLKPGNVHVFADGHRMTVADFEASATSSAAAIAAPDLPVGERIYRAIRATNDAVGCNTNLGIVLLCAPLAAAALNGSGRDLRGRLAQVLEQLDTADAEQAFAAIRLASPAGLGAAPEHDVRQPAQVSLLAAMQAASFRDRIAAQYANQFRDVFTLGVERLEAGLARWRDLRWATTSAYLGFLAAFPDSHIERKFGSARAAEVRTLARPYDEELLGHSRPEDMAEALLRFDAALKQEGLNPGTSADLTVASLLARNLAASLAED